MVGLADTAKVTIEECQQAIAFLTSPDPYDTSKVEEGRRLREIPGGWQVINNDLYRFSTEAKRELWRITKQEQREREKQSREAYKRGLVKGRQKVLKRAETAGEIAGRTRTVVEEISRANQESSQ